MHVRHGTGVAGTQVGVFDNDVDVGTDFGGSASLNGRSNAVATSRAMPTTDMQSGRLAVISKSRTASAFAVFGSLRDPTGQC